MALNRFILLGVLLSALYLSRQIAWDDDEFQHAHMSMLIAKGEVPHRDFFEHHLSLYHLLHAPIMAFADGPEDLLTLRTLSVAYLTLTLLLASRILILRTGHAPPSLFLWVSCSPIFLIKMLEARPESLGLFFGMAALFYLSSLITGPFRAGLFISAMVLCSQKFVFLGFGLFLICLIEQGWKPTLRLVLGGLPLSILYVGWLTFTGAIAPAWEHLVVMNSQWKESFSPLMYGNLLWRTSGLFILMALTGLMMTKRKAPWILLLSGLLGVLAVPIPFRQTLLMLYPGLLLAAAWGWNLCRPVLGRMTLGLLTLLGILPGIANILQESKQTLDADIAHMRQVSEFISGPVFDGRGLLFWRDHVGFYPWLHQGLSQMLDDETYSQHVQDALIESNYPPILRDYRTELFPESLLTFIGNHYLESDIPDLLMPGIQLDRSKLAGSGTTWTVPVSGNWKADWKGGRITLNGTDLTQGKTVYLEQGPVEIRGNGFIRDFQIIQTGDAP